MITQPENTIQKTHYEDQFLEIITGLNNAQRQAVEQTEGPVMAIAGPGTGKTQVLAARIGNLLLSDEAQVSPHNILCLTFTDAGTVAMRDRLAEFIGPSAYDVHIFTFHGFCNRVIQDNLNYFGIRDLQPASDLETVEILHRLIDEFGPKHPLKRFTGEVYYDLPRLAGLFDTMKRENLSEKLIIEKTDAYLDDLPNREGFFYKRDNKKAGIKAGDANSNKINDEKERFEKLKAAAGEFKNYQRLLREAKRYDYNDMILWVTEAFEKNEILLARYREQYLYFLADEYQDTNGAQNRILELLSSFWDIPNVFVVGDDDQSIFRFQGAGTENILDFYQKHQKNLATVVLTENYRSSTQILRAAQALIDLNPSRLTHQIGGLDKMLVAAGNTANSPASPQVIEYKTIIHEEAGIAKALEELKEKGENLSEVAVIYRNHRQAENLAKIAELRNIPITIRQRVNILTLPLTRKLLTLLRYVSEEYEKPNSAEHLLYELMHYDFFGISVRDIAVISRECAKRKNGEKTPWRSMTASKERLFQLGAESTGAIADLDTFLTSIIRSASECTLQMMFEHLLNEGNILDHLLQSPEKAHAVQELTTFFDFIKDESAKNPDLRLKEFLALIDTMKKNKIPLGFNKITGGEGGVHFITAHSAKGLEFKHVFIIGCTSDKWEKKRGANFGFRLPDTLISSATENTDEEERRLFYVAMTRAKEFLTISYARQSNEEKLLEKSRFVAETTERGGLSVEEAEASEAIITEFSAGLLTKSPLPKQQDYIDQKFVKEALKGFRMSVTALNKYLRCPRTFYFENILKVPQARSIHMGFGSAVHYALEQFFLLMSKSEHKKFPPKEKLYTLFINGMNIYRSHFTDKEYNDRTEYAAQILPDYYDKYIGGWNKDVLTEHKIHHVNVEGVPMSGTLDKIEFEGAGINVVDYKTGSPEAGLKKLRGPSEKEPNGGDYWRQIIFYKILTDNDRKLSKRMISGEADFIQKTKKGDFAKEKIMITPEAVAMVTTQIKEVYAKINRGQFYEGCEDENCRWCANAELFFGIK